jgi:hypothetical protein
MPGKPTLGSAERGLINPFTSPTIEVAGRTLRALGTDVPTRAAELVAAQFDTVATAAEECDALVATGVMPAGVWL